MRFRSAIMGVWPYAGSQKLLAMNIVVIKGPSGIRLR